MRKQFILMGRYTLLILIAAAVGVAAVALTMLPDWLIRVGGVVGGGWIACRIVWYQVERIAERTSR